jgi:hypothetical protein
MPSNPNLQYKDEWTGMPDFLGYKASGRGRRLGTVNAVVTKEDKEDKEKSNIFEDRVVETSYYDYATACQKCQTFGYTATLYRKFITNLTTPTAGTMYARLPKYPEGYYPEFKAEEFYLQKETKSVVVEEDEEGE